MPSNFIYEFIFLWEGGYNATLDGGTNKGITFKTYQSLAKKLTGKNPTLENFKNLSNSEAKKFIDYFYNFYGANKLQNDNLADWYLNFVWGSGGWAASTLIKTLNKYYNAGIHDKGKESILTAQIANYCNNITDQKKLLKNCIQGQTDFYKRIIKANPNYKKYATGWQNRLIDFAEKKGFTVQNLPAAQNNTGGRSLQIIIPIIFFVGGLLILEKNHR